MSVIAKMNVTDVREFGRAGLVTLNCVYESNGLNASGKGWEDRRFTTATPWGEGELTTPRDSLFHAPGKTPEGYLYDGSYQQVYLVFRRPGEVAPEPTLVCMPVKVKKREAGSYKRVEIVLDRDRAGPEKDTALNLRMAIDNPAAFDQFDEGATFDLSIYDASKVTLAEAAA